MAHSTTDMGMSRSAAIQRVEAEQVRIIDIFPIVAVQAAQQLTRLYANICVA
jgi:hypothetical protein